jgi:hypothetical protein
LYGNFTELSSCGLRNMAEFLLAASTFASRLRTLRADRLSRGIQRISVVSLPLTIRFENSDSEANYRGVAQ